MTSQAYQQYRAMMKQGRYTDAALLAEQHYLVGDPNNPFWLTRRAAALSRSGRFDQALGVAKEAYALDSQNAYGILAVAEAYQGLGRDEEALAYFEAVVQHPKLARFAQNGVLRSLAAKKDWDGILEKLAAWDLARPVMLQWKVKALEGRGQIEPAIAACGQWLALQPDHPAALWALTELEIKRDGLEAILGRMARLAKIGSRPPIYKEIYASLCRRAGKHERALKTYADLSQTASDPRILSKQAFALAKSGRESEAIPLLEALLKLDPENVYLHASYQAACKRIGQPERALNCYEQLLDAHPQAKSLYGRIRGIKKSLTPQKSEDR